MEKKNYFLNCDVCDARNIKENIFEEYEEIRINTDILLVSGQSRAILNRYPIHLNVDKVIEAAEDVDLRVQNGEVEISAENEPPQKTVLVVNGTLKIKPHTSQTLKKYIATVVNGTVTYPQSMENFLTNMTVNGTMKSYPDDCVLLKRTAILDKIFPLRAKENGSYYAERKMVMLEQSMDLSLLGEKKVRFVTPRLLITESMVEKAIVLFSEETELTVVEDGCSYCGEDVILDEVLLQKYGNKIYVDGSLTVTEESAPALLEAEYLYVNGNVYLQEGQKKTFLEKHAKYESLVELKGSLLQRRMEVIVDEATLKNAPSGLCLLKCIRVILDGTLTDTQIREQLQFISCQEIVCSRAQRAAVEFAGKKIANVTITDETEEKMQKKFYGTKINADIYVL